jgi:hypothetical protein
MSIVKQRSTIERSLLARTMVTLYDGFPLKSEIVCTAVSFAFASGSRLVLRFRLTTGLGHTSMYTFFLISFEYNFMRMNQVVLTSTVLSQQLWRQHSLAHSGESRAYKRGPNSKCTLQEAGWCQRNRRTAIGNGIFHFNL